MSAFTRALATNNYGPCKFIVDGTTVANGTHSTIQAAVTSASSGDTIFIRPGTYVENITGKAGINLVSFDADCLTPTVTISGTITFTLAGTMSISGIRLQTNSAALLAVTGSAASIVNLKNCYLNCTNNTGITFSAANTAATITLEGCHGDLGTTGIGLYTMSSTGTLQINYCQSITNTGASTTASSNSAGTVGISFSRCTFPISTSSGGIVNLGNSGFDTSAQNVTPLTLAGTGSSASNGTIYNSGSASSVSVGTGCTLVSIRDTFSSTNTNAVTGAGTFSQIGAQFANTSHQVNTTTNVGGAINGLTQGTAPSVGLLGEQITSGSQTTTFSNGSAKNLTSINLTAGIWDITFICNITFSGGTGVGSSVAGAISVNTGSFTGTVQGDSRWDYGSSALFASGTSVVPAFRVVISATTTYYGVISTQFTATTATGLGRLSAVRVG